jgi:hypothetical protein
MSRVCAQASVVRKEEEMKRIKRKLSFFIVNI